jgi:hypothetical protein
MFETPARIMKRREAIRALKNAGPQWLHKMEVFTYPPCTSESADPVCWSPLSPATQT